jgi:lysophospholipase L1-like esterase
MLIGIGGILLFRLRAGWGFGWLRCGLAVTLSGCLVAVVASGQKPASPATPTTQVPSSQADSGYKPVEATKSSQEMAQQQARFEQDETMLKDWPNLKHYGEDDAALAASGAEKRVVFMGDSITQGWMNHGTGASEANPGFFPGKPYVDRGISGQTTPQMVLRFQQDVIHLKPTAVVIFAGVNDIAGNTGDMTPEQTQDNLVSMAELAHANGIRVVLCSILPAFDFPWKRGREPAPKIVALNQWIEGYAAEHGYVYVDFYSAMVDERGGLPEKLSRDGVHPNAAGYAIMNPLVEAGIAEALKK